MGEFDYHFDFHKERVQFRQHLRKLIVQAYGNVKIFAEQQEMRESGLSKFFRNRQSIQLEQLDKITEALGLPEGHLYEKYRGECFSEDTKRLRLDKTEEFVVKCLAMGLGEFAEWTLNQLLNESRRNIKMIFALAEKLFDQRQFELAKPLYRKVIREETNLLVDHLSISSLRYFQMVRSDIRSAYRAMLELERCVDKLPSREDKLEALLLLTRYHSVHGDYTEAEKQADQLIQLAKDYSMTMYGNGLVLKGICCYEQQRYAEALALSEQYGGINEYFRMVAEGNRLIYLTCLGYDEWVENLIAFAKNSNEIEAIFETVLTYYLANHRQEQTESFLREMASYLKPVKELENPYQMKCYLHYYFLRSVYLFQQKAYAEGIDTIFPALELADRLGLYSLFKKVMLLCFKYLPYASSEQTERFLAYLRTSDEGRDGDVLQFWSRLVKE